MKTLKRSLKLHSEKKDFALQYILRQSAWALSNEMLIILFLNQTYHDIL